jgi:hypothetical protein
MYISDYSSPIRKELKPCFDISIEVLNNYFNPKSEYFLGNKLFENTYHDCYKYIIRRMEKSKTPIRNTRKKHIK